MPPQWATANSWSVSYKNRRVCFINLSDGAWRIRCSGDYSVPIDSLVTDESLRETAFDNVSFCVGCNPCKPGRHTTILGKEFDNVCVCFHFIFQNPDAKTLESVKKIMEFRRNAICGNI